MITVSPASPPLPTIQLPITTKSLVACGRQVFEIEGFLSLDDPRVAACGDDAVLLGAYAVPISGETI